MVKGTRETALLMLPHLGFDFSDESDMVRFIRVCICISLSRCLCSLQKVCVKKLRRFNYQMSKKNKLKIYNFF